MALGAKIIVVLRTKIIVSTDSGDSGDSTDSVVGGGGVFFMGGSMSRGSCAGMHGAKIAPYYI